jgi:hypothetical protein
VLTFLHDRMEAFRKHAGASGFDGIENRITKHFAAIYAAGCLAHDYKVLVWSRNAMLKACLRCYRGVMDRHAAAKAAEEVEVKNRISRRWQQLKGRLSWIGDRNARTSGLKAPGWLKKQRSSNHQIILKPSTFHQDVCDGLRPSTVIRVLADKGILVRHQNGKSTVQRSIPGVDAARGHRYIVLRLKPLESWLSSKPDLSNSSIIRRSNRE